MTFIPAQGHKAKSWRRAIIIELWAILAPATCRRAQFGAPQPKLLQGPRADDALRLLTVFSFVDRPDGKGAAQWHNRRGRAPRFGQQKPTKSGSAARVPRVITQNPVPQRECGFKSHLRHHRSWLHRAISEIVVRAPAPGHRALSGAFSRRLPTSMRSSSGSEQQKSLVSRVGIRGDQRSVGNTVHAISLPAPGGRSALPAQQCGC